MTCSRKQQGIRGQRDGDMEVLEKELDMAIVMDGVVAVLVFLVELTALIKGRQRTMDTMPYVMFQNFTFTLHS